MKKFVTVFIAAVCAVICAFSLAACGDNGNTNNNGGNGGNTDNEQPQTVAVTSITLNKSTLSLDIGETETLIASVKPDNATNKTVTWSSDKPEIASVDNSGKVTAKADGTAVITATADGKSDTCTVTVNKKAETPDDTVSVTEVKLNKTSLTLDIDDTETLIASVKPDNATNKTVTWSSDKPAIASVDNSGKVTAKADGTAVITATADGKSDTCTVTVNKATEVEPNAYAEIAETCKVLAEKGGRTNVEILTICQDEEGYLTFAFKDDYGYGRYTTDIELGATLESAKSVNINALAKSELYVLEKFSKGVYNSDGTANEKQTVESMVAKLLGDGYTVMWGAISAAANKGADSVLGDSAAFNIYALLEKDGKVYEYKETVTATKRLGDVYQAVLNSTETNKDNIYKYNHTTPTDLGEVAALYLAEVNRTAESK